ncbi:MAG: tRNA lysidine(34) synthetase TilS [Planctomycetota bacterium]|jgi:tRNA(Ile)-lysidine synthase
MRFEFEQKICDFIQVHGLFEPTDNVLLAVSGGADSIGLLYAMAALKRGGVFGGELFCGHVNHGLRGFAGQADEDFVASEAAKFGISTIPRHLDVRGYAGEKKLSIETAGRDLRIAALVEIAKSQGCAVVATAHQKNDNAETLLHRLARGTGYRGLAGIWPRRGFYGIEFVRPLLCVRRDEIIGYLRSRNLSWRTDDTNYDCRYRRNYIRHRLLPALEQDCGGDLVGPLSELADSARRLYGVVCRRVDEVWPVPADLDGEEVAVDLKTFVSEPPLVQVELVRRSLVKVGSGERDLTEGHYQRILGLASEKASGKTVVLAEGFVVRREYGNLIFGRQETTEAAQQGGAKVQIPGQTRFGDYLIETGVFDAEIQAGKFNGGKTSFVEWFDMEKLSLPLEVRFRRRGERFVPLGLAKEKKVGKFLTAQRVPSRIRSRTLIVADSEKVIWVWPIRMSEQAKVTDKTRRILRLEITEASKADQIQLSGEDHERT